MGGVICISNVIDISIDISIFLLISACVSSSPAFSKMCSAYKLNKQGDNIVVFVFCFLFFSPNFKPSVFLYLVLTVVS